MLCAPFQAFARMASTYECNLTQLLKLCNKHPTVLRAPAIIPKDAIVVCSRSGFKNAVRDVSYVGRVLHSGSAVNLVAPQKKKTHPDGKIGEVFVWAHDKQKKINKSKLSSECVILCIVTTIHCAIRVHDFAGASGWWNKSECRCVPVQGQKIGNFEVVAVNYVGNTTNFKSDLLDNWTCVLQGCARQHSHSIPAHCARPIFPTLTVYIS